MWWGRWEVPGWAGLAGTHSEKDPGGPEHRKDTALPTNLEPSAGCSVLFRAGPPGGPFPQGFPSSWRLNKG